jgi:hypothetical protein
MASWLLVLAHQLLLGDIILAIALVLLISCAVYYVLRLCGLWQGADSGQRYARFAWQLGILLGLEQGYELVRGQIPRQTPVALLHAYRLLDLEWRHGFFIESRVERFFLHYQLVMNAVDVFYVAAHLVVTLGILIWVYARHRSHYPFLRNVLAVTTALALVAFYVYPTAPPRLLANYGFVDPAQLHHLVPEGGAQLDSYTYNPYAAMPSLHVAYALIVGWVVILVDRRLWARALGGLYPCAMAAAVVISGNHWVLDVAGAAITVGLAGLLVLAMSTCQSMVRGRSLNGSLVVRRRRAYTVVE